MPGDGLKKKQKWRLLAELVLPGQRIVLACICTPENGEIESSCEMGEAAATPSGKGHVSLTAGQSVP